MKRIGIYRGAAFLEGIRHNHIVTITLPGNRGTTNGYVIGLGKVGAVTGPNQVEVFEL